MLTRRACRDQGRDRRGEVTLSRIETRAEVSEYSDQVSLVNPTRPAGARRRRLSQDEERAIAQLYAETSTPTAGIRARVGIGDTSVDRAVRRHRGTRRRGTGPSAQSQPRRTTASAA